MLTYASKPMKYVTLSLALVSAAALAGEIVVNGQRIICEHECMIFTSPNGGWLVKDSVEGGWVINAPTDQESPMEP